MCFIQIILLCKFCKPLSDVSRITLLTVMVNSYIIYVLKILSLKNIFTLDQFLNVTCVDSFELSVHNILTARDLNGKFLKSSDECYFLKM